MYIHTYTSESLLELALSKVFVIPQINSIYIDEIKKCSEIFSNKETNILKMPKCSQLSFWNDYSNHKIGKFYIASFILYIFIIILC